jgi:hypothetical protein
MGNFRNIHRTLLALGLSIAFNVVRQADAVTITYVNSGSSDSRVHGTNFNDSSGYSSSTSLDHTNAISHNDTVYGPLPPAGQLPNFDSQTFAGIELGTNLNAPLGTGVRTVFTPFNPGFFRASGMTLQASGFYTADAHVFSGDTVSTTPTPWIINVDPSGAEVPGTPTDVTVTATIDGVVTAAGSATADATWNVATTAYGTVISGAASQTVPGSTPFTDNATLNFTIPLGTDFQLLVDYALSVSGSGAGASSNSELTLVQPGGPFGGIVEVSAAVQPPPMFAPVAGAKLLMIDKYAVSGKAKVVLILKDTTPGSIGKGPAATPAGLSGQVILFQESDPFNRAIFDLDGSGWVKNKGTVAKYKNKAAAVGTDGVRAVTVKEDKKLKVVARNLGDGDSASGDQSATDIDLSALTTSDAIMAVITIDNANDSSSHRMCARFTAPTIKAIGGGAGIKVLSKTSTLPVSCPW